MMVKRVNIRGLAKKCEERSEKKSGSELSKDQKDDTSDTTAHAVKKSIAEEQVSDQEKHLLEQVKKVIDRAHEY